MSTTRSMRRLTGVALVVLLLAFPLPADAFSTGAFSFSLTETVPDYPCAGSGCQVSSLQGRISGTIARTAPNGVTVCAPSCTVTEGPAGLANDSTPCIGNVLPNQLYNFGQIQVNGGHVVGASSTPLVLNVEFVAYGVVMIGFVNGGLGQFAGAVRPVSGVDCIGQNGPATFQIIGAGVFADL